MRVTVEFTTGSKANQRRADAVGRYADGREPCELCGVPVHPSKVRMVEFSIDRDVIVDEKNAEDSQGCFPVGPDCYRKIERAIKAELATHAGFIATAKHPMTNAWLVLYRSEDQKLDPFAGRYSTVCVRHAWIVSHTSLKLARAHLRNGGWCEPCEVIARDEGYRVVGE